jgi:hydroxyethylthiazole kinase-like sugar kinase family protein
MAKGGSGDVLSGITGAMLAQGLKPEDAAVFSVYFHGLCGDLACGQNGEYSTAPSDLIANIPNAFKEIQEYIAGKSGRRDPASGNPASCGPACGNGFGEANG